MIEAARSYGANTSGERRACDSLLATGKENIMAREISNQVQYYYDYHPTEEDLMGETAWHSELIDYLKAVLLWLFHDQTCAIYYLRLYDREMDLCLTRAEAQTLLAEEEAERANEEAERAREAIRKAEALAEKLRSLGINPDEIA